jgi:hypothetical protein
MSKAWITAVAVAAVAVTAQAAGDPSRLKGELSPLGAERAGNKDGSIPAWTGGYTTPIPGDRPGGRRGDPFGNEKPLFSITGKNVDQYADKLNEGQRALLKKTPDYRIDVYRTHRTAAAPQWVYDNTARNTTRAKLNGDLVEGAYGGIPFPIPQNGAEVMWNHLLRWRGTSWQFQNTQYQVTADGRPVLTAEAVGDQQMPYYMPHGSAEEFAKGDQVYWKVRLLTVGPPLRAGEAIVGNINIDGNKDQAWVYLAGQRRTRKLPNPCCDTPTPAMVGLMSFDEVETWAGRLDRFDWKLVGKQEMYIPYNGNRLLQPKTDGEVLAKTGLNPDHVRWELHRVWVVDATLRPGQRHQATRSRYYCEEDTWTCVLADRWDGKGQLWKTFWYQTFVAPDLPGTVGGAFGFSDLLSGQAYVTNLVNTKNAHYVLKPKYPDSTFTPEAMAGEGVR